MAASEIYDYLSATPVTPDYTDAALSISPQGVLVEEGENNVKIHEAEDGTEERIVLASSPVFYITFPFNGLNEADAGTVFDFYFNSGKGNGRARSFKWQHVDGYQYVVRFDTKLNRNMIIAGSLYSFQEIRLKILGRVS